MERGVAAEVKFAQKLASNEKKIRDRAIKRLNRYLSVRSRHAAGLSESDLLKIWKGLFYCMWMQDKPLIQEELSQRITSLVHCFPKTEDALLFVKVFLETQSREWNGIDRLRLDKFLMMAREMMFQTLTLLSKADWQESHCRTFALALYKNVMNAHEPRLPDGLKIHMADIFIEEMKKTSAEKLTTKTMLILLQPFVEFILFTNKIELARRVISEVIYKVLKAISRRRKVVETDENAEMDEDMETDVSNQQKRNQRCFHVDKGLLLKLMFDMAGSKIVRASNRELVYNLVRRNSKFFNNSANALSGSEQTTDIPLSEDGKHQEHHFVCDLQFLRDDGKAVDQQQRKKKRKKRRNKEGDSTTEDAVSIGTVETIVNRDETIKAKKKKEKSSNDENATGAPHVNTSKNSQIGHENTNKNSVKIVSSNLEHTDLQTPVLADIKGLSNKLNSKNKQNISLTCVNTADTGNRKRKFVSDDDSKDLSSSKKKKSKRIVTESEEESTNSIGESTTEKTVNSAAVALYAKILGADSTFSFDNVQSTMDTNSNARPKCRSGSPPKISPAVSPVVLVKYTSKAKQDIAKIQPKNLLTSPPVTQFPISDSITDLASSPSEMDISVDASSQTEKEVLFHKNETDVSASGLIKATGRRKVRSKSESSTKQDTEKKFASPSASRHTGDLRSAQSVPSSMVTKTACIIRTEEKGTPSGLGSKKKVIFDLRRNKANKFQDYLKSIAKQPDPPFQPTKSPVAGILKSPVMSPSPSEVSCADSECTTSVSTSKKGLGYGRRASAPSILVRSPGIKRKKSLFKSTVRQSSPSH